MDVKEFDTVILKDGRRADVMEVFPDGSLILDVGNSPEDWETIYDKTIDDIKEIVKK